MLCCHNSILPNSLCCYEQDYAWVKHGMIFPFLEYLDKWVITHSDYFNFLREISSFFYSLANCHYNVVIFYWHEDSNLVHFLIE